METRPPQFDGSQDLDALALSRDGDFRRVPDATPSGMQRGVLPKTGFIGENQRRALGSVFFLRLGWVRRCQRSCEAAAARARTRRGRCTEKPIWCSNFRTCPGWYVMPNSSSITQASIGEVRTPVAKPWA